MAKKTLKEKKQDKIGKVITEGQKGQLHIGKSDKISKDPKQQLAIALNIASKIGKKKKK